MTVVVIYCPAGQWAADCCVGPACIGASVPGNLSQVFTSDKWEFNNPCINIYQIILADRKIKISFKYLPSWSEIWGVNY